MPPPQIEEVPIFPFRVSDHSTYGIPFRCAPLGQFHSRGQLMVAFLASVGFHLALVSLLSMIEVTVEQDSTVSLPIDAGDRSPVYYTGADEEDLMPAVTDAKDEEVAIQPTLEQLPEKQQTGPLQPTKAPQSLLSNASTVESYGLRVTIKEIRRIGPTGDKVEFAYAFQRVPTARNVGPFIFLRSWSVIQVYFSDASGNAVSKPVSVGYVVPEPFLEVKTSLYEDSSVVTVPDGAVRLAIEVGASGIVTKPVAIPARADQ